MKLELTAELGYTTFEPCVILLNVHAVAKPQVILEENFVVTGHQHFTEIASFPDNNRLIRINAQSAGTIHCLYTATVDNRYTVVDCDGAPPVDAALIHPEVLRYLNPSRFCQSDKLYRLAGHQFGKIDNDFDKVRAITEWIYENVEYLSGSTNAETSAYDTVTQQAGVCRDFAHLGIALCRALTIPARYCAVYAYQLIPQDFHACFEAFIAGKWIFFDATRLAPLNGMARIAVGRDAADTAIANLFGNVMGHLLLVSVSSPEKDFSPVFYTGHDRKGISYD